MVCCLLAVCVEFDYCVCLELVRMIVLLMVACLLCWCSCGCWVCYLCAGVLSVDLWFGLGCVCSWVGLLLGF